MRKLATLLLAATIACTAGAALASAQEKKTESPESKEGGLEVWKWANFLVLAGGLGYLIGKHAGPFFQARSHKIRQDMAEGELALKEAKARADQVARRLANLEADIAALHEESKAEIEAETQRMASRTAAELAKIRAQAVSEIASAGKAARAELKRYSADLAVALAEQKVRARMNPQAQEALVEAFVHDLANPAARSESV